MTAAEIFKIAAAIIASLGGGGIIVAALANWLGRLWAERLMAKEKSKFEGELAELRSKLERNNQECLTRLKTELDISRETFLKHHNDKLGTYAFACGLVADFLADLDMIRRGQKPDGNVLDRFNRNRLKAHGHLAILAPQEVMDSYDALIDEIFFITERNPPKTPQEDWVEIRRLAYSLINAMRKDVGIDKSAIEYRGRR